MTGIYLIQNLVNGKVYVGQSRDIAKRWAIYQRGDFHGNKGLERDHNKYGLKAFRFSVLKECSVEELDFYEWLYVKQYSSLELGYNIRPPKDYSRLTPAKIEQLKHKLLGAFSRLPDGNYRAGQVAETLRMNAKELRIVLGKIDWRDEQEHDTCLWVNWASPYETSVIKKTSWERHEELQREAAEMYL